MLLASDKAHPSLRFSARTIIVFILLWRFLKRREHKDFFAKDAEICTHSLRSLRLNLCVLCVKHFLPIGAKSEIYFFGTTLCFFQSRLARAPLSRSSGIAVPGVRLLDAALLKSHKGDDFAKLSQASTDIHPLYSNRVILIHHESLNVWAHF